MEVEDVFWVFLRQSRYDFPRISLSSSAVYETVML